MRMCGVALIVVACSGSPATPDAEIDYFGNGCTDDGTAPLTTCMNARDQTGWCIVGDMPPAGICRRGCIANACPFAQTPVPIFNDCYCMP